MIKKIVTNIGYMLMMCGILAVIGLLTTAIDGMPF